MSSRSKAIWHGGGLDLGALNASGQNCMNALLGIHFVQYGDDWLAAVMPVDDRTRQPFGLLHGGASLALAETVSSVAGTSTLDPALRFVVGMELNANHIRSVTQGFVRAVARAEYLGKSTQVWTVRITDPEDRLVCLSRATLAVRAASGAPLLKNRRPA